MERKSSGSEGEESDTSIDGSGVWKFEFEEGLAPCNGVPNRMEEMAETLSTLEEPSTFDSEETMATGSPRTNPNDPAPAYGYGPPFATGDIVVVQLDENVTLMRAFVCEANHPWYCLQFPDSKLVRVNANEVAMSRRSCFISSVSSKLNLLDLGNMATSFAFALTSLLSGNCKQYQG